MRFFSALAMWLCVSALAFGQDEPLPDSVTTPYLAYEAARADGDLAETARTADLAWRAAEAEGIDSGTTAILAMNAGDAFVSIRDLDQALEAYERSIALQEQGDYDPATLGTVYRLASEIQLANGEYRRASRMADRALQLHENLTGVIGVSHRFRSYLVRIQAESGQGQFDRAGRIAEEAFDEGRAVYDEMPHSYGLPAFYIGAHNAYEDRQQDAAYWFSVSYALLAPVERQMTIRDAADAWGDYIREDLSQVSQQYVWERLVEGGYLLDSESEQARASVGINRDKPIGFLSAQPVRRVPPQYPDNAARAGVEGFALIRYDVDETGRIQNPEVVYSLPYQDFGEASLEAIDEWEFQPATQDGVPVEETGRVVSMEFQLAN